MLKGEAKQGILGKHRRHGRIGVRLRLDDDRRADQLPCRLSLRRHHPSGCGRLRDDRSAVSADPEPIRAGGVGGRVRRCGDRRS